MKLSQKDEPLYDYILDVSLREHPILKELREYTASHKLASMQVSPDQAQFLQFLIGSIQAKTVLELGTFTGYSALAMALSLPKDGKLITCDINTEWTKDTSKFWGKALQEDKIELRLGPALNTLQNLLDTGYKGKFDFIFVDADKSNYPNYYQLVLDLLSPRGIIAIDNVLWKGEVIVPENVQAQTQGIRKLNSLIKNDDSVDVSLVTVADGIFLIRKKQSES